MIRRIVSVAAAVLAVALFAGPVHAAADGVTLDGSLILATEPAGGYDSTVGIGVGVLVDLSSRMKTSSKDMKLGLRGDLAYFDWEGNIYGTGVSYWRLMFFGGPRLTYQPGGRSDIAPYLEGGLELGYGEAEVVVPGIGRSGSTEIDLGLAGGGGVDFFLTKNIKLGINARLHLISDSFLAIGFTLGTIF